MSCVYAGSRTLLALSEQGFAPKLFSYVDKAGRPLWALAAVLIFFPIAYIVEDEEKGEEAFDWLIAVRGAALPHSYDKLTCNLSSYQGFLHWSLGFPSTLPTFVSEPPGRHKVIVLMSSLSAHSVEFGDLLWLPSFWFLCLLPSSTLCDSRLLSSKKSPADFLIPSGYLAHRWN